MSIYVLSNTHIQDLKSRESFRLDGKKILFTHNVVVILKSSSKATKFCKREEENVIQPPNYLYSFCHMLTLNFKDLKLINDQVVQTTELKLSNQYF